MLLVLSLVGCKSPAARQECGQLAIHGVGLGAFYGQGQSRSTQFLVRAASSYSGPAGAQVTVRRVEVFGASGILGPDRLLQHPLTLPADLTFPLRAVFHSPWDGQDEYSVLVRCIYDERWPDCECVERVAQAYGTFAWVRPSPRLVASIASSSDARPQQGTDYRDQIGNVAAGGTFIGAQSIALYDIEATWTSPASSIAVYAAAGNLTSVPQNPANRIGGTASPDNSAKQWHGYDLQGRYDGSDEYTLQILVTFASGTTESKLAVFRQIQSQQGTGIPLTF